MGIFDFLRKKETLVNASHSHHSVAEKMSDVEFILESLANEEDEVTVRNAINSYTDKETLKSISEQSSDVAKTIAKQRLKELTLEDLIKGRSNDCDSNFLQSLTDKERLKLIRACHGEAWAEESLSLITNQDNLKHAACVDNAKLGRLAVERLNAKTELEYVAQHSVIGNVRNYAKRHLREKFPEKIEVVEDTVDHSARKAKNIIKSLHAMEMLAKWQDLEEEFEINCVNWEKLEVSDEELLKQFEKYHQSCSKGLEAWRSENAVKLAEEKAQADGVSQREVLVLKVSEGIETYEALESVQEEWKALANLTNSVLDKAWYKQWTEAFKNAKMILDKQAKAEEDKANAGQKIEDLMTQLKDWVESKKVLPSKLHHLKEDWKKIAAYASHEAVEGYNKVLSDYQTYCDQAAEVETEQRTRVEELLKRIEEVEEVTKANTDRVKSARKEILELSKNLSDKRKISDALRKAEDKYFKLVEESHEGDAFLEMDNESKVEDLFDQARGWLASPADGKLFNKLKEFRNQWQSLRPLPKSRFEKIKAEFETLADATFAKWKEFNEEEDKRRDANLEVKKSLIEELGSSLHEWSNMSETMKKVKDLQKRWKESGPVRRDVADQIWQEFNSKSQAFYDEANAVMVKAEETKTQLLEQASQLAENLDKATNARQTVLDLRDKWKQVGFAGYKAEKALWDKFNVSCNAVFEVVNAQKNRLHEGLDKADAERKAFIDLAFDLSASLKESEGVRSAESFMYYTRIALSDLNRGHRKEDDKLYAMIDEKLAEFKGEKYEEADDKYVDLLQALLEGTASFSTDLSEFSPADKRVNRINRACQEMEKLSRQPVQYEEDADFDLKNAIKGLAFAMTISHEEEEDVLPPVNSKRAKQLLWTNSLRIFVEIQAESDENKQKYTERFVKAVKVFLDASHYSK
ncbi:DUF349 domain-containing protein [Lentisphaera profundi]|uniref:DUF349 domain-containing protein n=1 Tax=Lentisphaera profundi TaxID=1658616 RepID=A0ABY7VRC2_9BACT|nr:DUF349 domain-containing protein [Lentisphaera profundi]WDE96750.1 DUF349 domain-containing protein [Lentisphaera profundi]